MRKITILFIVLFSIISYGHHHKNDGYQHKLVASCGFFTDSKLKNFCKTLKSLEKAIEKQSIETERCYISNKTYYLFDQRAELPDEYSFGLHGANEGEKEIHNHRQEIDSINKDKFEKIYNTGKRSCAIESDRRLSVLKDRRRLVYKQYLVRIRDIKDRNKETARLKAVYNLKIKGFKSEKKCQYQPSNCRKKVKKTIKLNKNCRLKKVYNKFYGDISVVECSASQQYQGDWKVIN